MSTKQVDRAPVRELMPFRRQARLLSSDGGSKNGSQGISTASRAGAGIRRPSRQRLRSQPSAGLNEIPVPASARADRSGHHASRVKVVGTNRTERPVRPTLEAVVEQDPYEANVA